MMLSFYISTPSAIKLHVRLWDNPNPFAPTLVLVHGFPDNSLVWQQIAERLSPLFKVVAYDVRGAGQSDIATTTAEYKIPCLVEDLAAVIDYVSPAQKVHLVGHDWGSIQCWEAVTTPRLQHRIASFSSISGPSLDHAAYWMGEGLRRGSHEDRVKILNQLLHSWYIAAFHFPLAGQLTWRVAFNKWPLAIARLHRQLVADLFPTQANDGKHGVKLYRANFIERLFKPQIRTTDLPIQLIIPTQDKFVTPALFDYLPRWASRVWRKEIEAEHWVQLSHPDEISAYIREFVEFIEAE
ncbi:alpha/beta fold hydrolase [Agitococcus lubricus]|uniref:Pimeloyl-ACP methyl ester carboxylesterase n=1 Tax=Agitococcus lubricus TaxID=1077255 RepID=A0A2T5J097_9GAMM|nr:alpha/beta fold hydrolase [Agitococcus lubricus]PTQ89696.1 pimeloyl-ACP methyl ester carboxylesterase [Agitococcus lubricus]